MPVKITDDEIKIEKKVEPIKEVKSVVSNKRRDDDDDESERQPAKKPMGNISTKFKNSSFFKIDIKFEGRGILQRR